MPEDRTRQLAAIMFVDMVGYTALMQEDEERAWAQRDLHRDVLSSLVPQHGGEILQYYGDGTLSVFASAVKAVECAIEVQAELQGPPGVPVRIGVHTGDIVQDKEGVFGDGVNVASRIEALSAPGGILVSGKVFDEIKNHPSISSVPMGEFVLKNVKTPIALVAISNEGLTVPTSSEILAKTQGEIHVLPAEGGAGIAVGSAHSMEGPSGSGEWFIQAVKDRALIQWGLTYLAGAWVLLEIVGFASQELQWPSLVLQGLGLAAFIGFFIVLVVTWFHGERGRQRVRKSEILLIAGLLVVAGVALSTLTPGPERGLGDSTTAFSAAENSRPSIAVLPFENFSPNPDDAYFANGVQEDITSALSRIRTLRVPGRSSVEQYREGRPSTREIAAALGADFLLEGSARVVSGAVRVTVQLVDGRTDQHLWAEDYDRDFSVEEVIAIQSEVAQEVASRLRALITPAEAARIATVPTDDFEAFELSQRARYRWNMRTEADVREALRLYQAAIGVDPDFAGAYAGLADTYLVLANWGWLDPREAYSSGIFAAERALELDPLIASVHASLGGLHLWSTRDWIASERSFLRAMELDPDYAYAHSWYSALLSAVGRHRESLAEAEIAASLDPLAPAIAYGLSRSLFMARDFRRSIQEARRALEIHPDYGNLYNLLCNGLVAVGEFEEAEAPCRHQQEIAGTSHSLAMGILRAYQGNRDAAIREVEGVELAEGNGGTQPVFTAMVYAALGDADEAIHWLELAWEGSYPHLEYLGTHPFFDPLRGDDRFQDLLTRAGF